jgi:hypothetical protein
MLLANKLSKRARPHPQRKWLRATTVFSFSSGKEGHGRAFGSKINSYTVVQQVFLAA